MFVGTVDARLVALDAKSGKPLWNVPVAEGERPAESMAQLPQQDPLASRASIGATGVGIAMAPQVFENLVIVGITGVGYGLHPENAVVGIPGRYGRPGVLAAFDAATGKPVWQFEVTGPGWEGEYRLRTADGLDLGRDIAAERAAAPPRGAWRTAAAPVGHSHPRCRARPDLLRHRQSLAAMVDASRPATTLTLVPGGAGRAHRPTRVALPADSP